MISLAFEMPLLSNVPSCKQMDPRLISELNLQDVACGTSNPTAGDEETSLGA